MAETARNQDNTSNRFTSAGEATFESLQIPSALIAAARAVNIVNPSPIQVQGIQAIMSGRDVSMTAQTGRGKTMAYLLPIVAKIEEAKRLTATPTTRALVVVPTRELAHQIAKDGRELCDAVGLRIQALVGGAPISDDITALQIPPDIVVVTPRRAIILLRRPARIEVKSLMTFVVDEANELLHPSFRSDLKQICGHLPASRQNVFVSASLNRDARELLLEFSSNPLFVEVSPSRMPDTIAHSAYFVEELKDTLHTIEAIVKRLLSDSDTRSIVIFCNTRHGVRDLARDLNRLGIPATPFCKGEPDRAATMNAFKRGEFRVMVATDAAALGIHSAHTTHVIHCGMPRDESIFINRSGRTGRLGQESDSGESIIVVLPAPGALDRYLSYTRQLDITPRQFHVAPGGRIFEAPTARGSSQSTRGPVY